MGYKISIITPNFNYSRFLPMLFESIISQDYQNWEHIVVDDGSTDNSVEVIEKYVSLFPERIKLIKQCNKGQTKAINKALEYVHGDIIGWINSDDLFSPNSFTKIIETFSSDKSIDAVFGDIEIINNKGEIIKTNKYLPFDYVSGVFNGFGKIISSNAIFWKKKLTDSIDYMKEEFVYAMDSEYWSRLLYKRKVKHINYTISQFRWHDQAKTIIRRNKSSQAFINSLREDEYILTTSYSNLFISRLLPVKYALPIKLLYRLKRYVYRLINGHYLNAR
jgi:glycosyltransferase involved in cell wall biosynthesis